MLVDAEHHRGPIAEEARGGVLQRPEFDPRDIAQPHDGAAGWVGAHHDVAELLGRR